MSAGADEERTRRKTEAEDFKERFITGEHIDDDLELTEAILEKLGIGSRKRKKVLENLVTNDVETWGNLRALGSESENKKAIEAVGGKENVVAGTTLWNAIQEYNKRKEVRADIGNKAEDFDEKFGNGEQIHDGMVLTEEILGKLGVGPGSRKNVFENLMKNKVETWGNLRAVGSESENKKAIEAVGGKGNEVAETTLWNAVQEYNKRAARLERQAARKATAALGEVNNPNPDNAFTQVDETEPGITRFISRQLREELTGHADEDGPIRKRLQTDTNERFLELVDELEGLHGARKRLFVRDSMRSIVGRIISYLEGDPSRWLLLGGTRGCGKSVVGSLVVILLAAKGHVVLYQLRSVTMLILTEKVSEEDKAALDTVIQRARIPPIPWSNQVWELRSSKEAHAEFQKLFLRRRNFIFVQDLGDHKAEVPAEDGGGKRLIVSSPDAERLETIRRKNRVQLIIMPTWTLEEIKQVKAVDPDSVRARFNRVGGIPRWVVDQEKGETERVQDEQIQNLSLSSLALVFGLRGYLNLPSQVDKENSKKSTDLIFRIEPKSRTNNGECQVVLTSPHVEEKLAERYLKGTEDEVLQFASVIQKTDRLSDLRGKTLEGPSIAQSS